jgi:hypothetical protein
MADFIRAFGKINVFPWVCYVLSASFLIAFFQQVGFPPEQPISATSFIYVTLALFLFMLPEAKKIRLGQLFEYESRVQRIREDVRQFKEETRMLLATYSSVVSAISNTVNHSVTVNLPGKAEEVEAKQDLESALGPEKQNPEMDASVARFVQSEDSDLNYGLAKLRMQLERELRRILSKRTESTDFLDQNTKYLSTRSLFSEFAQKHPRYANLRSSFDYVLKVCNAAIHGQSIPAGHAYETVSMGVRLLAELKKINE